MAVSPPKAPPKAAPRATVAFTAADRAEVVVPAGLTATRERVRRRGWLAALVLPVVVVALAAIVLEIPAEGHIANLLGVTGSLLALLAVPTAVAFGIPVEVGPVRAGLAVATSLLLWALARAHGQAGGCRNASSADGASGSSSSAGSCSASGPACSQASACSSTSPAEARLTPSRGRRAGRASPDRCLAPRAAGRPR